MQYAYLAKQKEDADITYTYVELLYIYIYIYIYIYAKLNLYFPFYQDFSIFCINSVTGAVKFQYSAL
jgi:hypothetical protein